MARDRKQFVVKNKLKLLSILFIFLFINFILFGCVQDQELRNQNSDTSGCYKYQDEGAREFCYYQTAIQTNNPALCEETVMMKNGCYLIIASQTKNKSLCLKTTNPTSCYKEIDHTAFK